jgi:hypothetical protein
MFAHGDALAMVWSSRGLQWPPVASGPTISNVRQRGTTFGQVICVGNSPGLREYRPTPEMAKQEGAAKRKAARRTQPPLPPTTQEAVQRLEKLAKELDSASDEAKAVADIVRTDLVNELTKYQDDDSMKKTRRR